MHDQLINQTMQVWNEPGAQCQPLGPRPCPQYVGTSLKDPWALIAVIACQQLGTTAADISRATRVGEDSQRLIAELKTADAQRLNDELEKALHRFAKRKHK